MRKNIDENKKEILVLAIHLENYFGESCKGIEELYSFNFSNFILKGIRKIMLESRFLPKRIWLGSWVKQLKSINTVVIFDTQNGPAIIRYIKRANPNIKVIFWYWNSVGSSIPVNKVNRKLCDIWSYNRKDCEKYNLKYNTQFYFFESQGEIKKNLYDVYFIGADKNRSKKLFDLACEFEKQGITYKYILTKYRNSKERDIKYSQPISYDDSLKNTRQAKAVLDLIDFSQVSGITLRPFEAAANHKKYITNDPTVKELRFYTKDNVFIIGEDNLSELKEFINKAYDSSIDDAARYYDFKEWLKRFD